MVTPAVGQNARVDDMDLAHGPGIESRLQKQFLKQPIVPDLDIAAAAQARSVLELQLWVPETSIQALKSLTLTASVGGSTLAPETYRKAGAYTYRRDVDPKLISGDAVRIDFQLDKTMPPGAADLRELGIVVTSAGLVAK